MQANTILSDIDACVFDAYGTLFDINAATRRCRDALGEAADGVSEIWRRKQLEYSWLRSLRGDYVDFWHVTGEALDFALASFGITDFALRTRLMECYLILAPYPEANAVLAALRERRMRTAILSNGSPSMLVAALQNSGFDLLLNEFISVDEVRIYKPHPSVYQLAVDRLHVPAGRIAFVSANGWDALGAAHFGFRVVWLNRAGALRDTLPGVIAAEIASLDALPALLAPAAQP